MKRACVIGWPIAHSRSPLIHGYWLRRYGIDGAYEREPVTPEALRDFLRELPSRGWVGCNVTVPHKEAAFAMAELRDVSATAIGAANTLWIEDGKLACSNTDAYGFMTNLTATAPRWRDADGASLVLGAGGSARAVVHGFLQSGRRDIRICNRSGDRARALAQHFGPGVTAHEWSERNDLAAAAAVIVNATTLGMNDAGSPDIDWAGRR